MVHDIDHKPARHRAHECSDHACMNSTARRPWPRCWFVLEPTLSLSAVIQLRFKVALSENVTKTAGELYFIWNFSKYEAPNLKMYRPICVPSYFIMFVLVWRAVTTESKRSIERILRYTEFSQPVWTLRRLGLPWTQIYVVQSHLRFAPQQSFLMRNML